jgi:hypothetical protein
MSDYENENWNDEYQDDIESHGMPLIRQGQSNSPRCSKASSASATS